MPPRIGLGVSEFRELRSRQLVYIDKSLLLEELVQDEAKAILLTRPRRFGKTLNLSMMRTFFERGTPEDAAARWGLFADLAIASASPEVRGHFARYPVIALSLKGVKTDRWDECREALALVIALHSGYLKPLRLTRVDGLPIATLAIPNREVQSIYRELLLNWVDGGVGGERNRRALCAAVLAGDAETVERHVQTWLMASASFHDTARPPEKFYHGFVLGLLVDLSQTHDVRSNRESGAGRCDVLVLPRRPGLPGVALELKVRDTRHHQSVESALLVAHTQLRERDYAAALRQAGAAPVRQLALVFDGKTVHVTAA